MSACPPNVAGDTPTLISMERVTVVSSRLTERILAEEINWTVREGDYWAIGGLQSSGKSDLLATAAALVPPRAGTIRLFGCEVANAGEAELRAARLNIGVVFETARLLSQLTIAENIALPLRYHRNLSLEDCAGRVEQLFQLASLPAEWIPLMPGAISGAMQRRVALARALALEPKLLLLDNPLSGLDLRDSLWWLDLLDTLAAGHPSLGGAPITLVVTGASLEPWRGRARAFGALKDRRLLLLGDRQSLDRNSSTAGDLLGLVPRASRET